MALGDYCHFLRCSMAGLGPAALGYCPCGRPMGWLASPQCVRSLGCRMLSPVTLLPWVCVCLVSMVLWRSLTGVRVRFGVCLVWRVCGVHGQLRAECAVCVVSVAPLGLLFYLSLFCLASRFVFGLVFFQICVHCVCVACRSLAAALLCFMAFAFFFKAEKRRKGENSVRTQQAQAQAPCSGVAYFFLGTAVSRMRGSSKSTCIIYNFTNTAFLGRNAMP